MYIFDLTREGELNTKSVYSVRTIYGSTIHFDNPRDIRVSLSNDRRHLILERGPEQGPAHLIDRFEFRYHGPDLPEPWKQTTALNHRGKKKQRELIESIQGFWQVEDITSGSDPFMQVSEAAIVYLSSDHKIPFQIWSAYGSTIYIRIEVEFGRYLILMELSSDRRRMTFIGGGERKSFLYRGKSTPLGIIKRN